MLKKKYLTKLEQEGRDVEGKLLGAGTPIIRHPGAPAEFMADSPENRELFEKKNRAWSDSTRQEIYFPARKDWNPGLVAEFETARTHCREFCSAIDQNVGSTQGKQLPDANLPAWLFALPYMPKIKSIEQVAELGPALAEKICWLGNAPAGTSLPEDWREALAGIQKVTIYELTGQFGRFHVVSAFAFPIEFSPGNQPKSSKPDSALLNAIQSIYEEWALKKRSVNYTFFTIGTTQPWPAEMTGTASGRSWTSLSSASSDKRWATSTPPQFASKLYLRNFLEALRPETFEQVVERVKGAVDEKIGGGFPGNIRLELIAKKTSYRRTIIRHAFQSMQESGHYECYWVDKELAIQKRTDKGAIVIHPQEHPYVKYRLGILLPAALGILGWQCLNYVTSGEFQVLSFLIVPPFVYAGKCLEIVIKRHQADL